jgi:hypothetical protein
VKVIEKNGMICPIEMIKDKEKLGYLKSNVVRILEDRKEGFIANKRAKVNKDFFFDFDSCDKTPSLGKAVTFYPSVNISKNHYLEPVALNITVEADKYCIINRVINDKKKRKLLGWAKDIESDEILFFSIPNSYYNKKIKLKIGPIYEGNVYTYEVVERFQPDSYRDTQIYLIARIDE